MCAYTHILPHGLERNHTEHSCPVFLHPAQWGHLSLQLAQVSAWASQAMHHSCCLQTRCSGGEQKKRFSSRAFSNCSSHFSSPVVISSLKNQLLPEPGKLFQPHHSSRYERQNNLLQRHIQHKGRRAACADSGSQIAHFLKTPNSFHCESCAV